MKFKLSFAVVLITASIVGCAHLNPGSDPLVVRTEQLQSTASSTFDLVLHEDQANRGFWLTNAPAFHTFCEWLRTPQVYNGTNVARCVAIQYNIDALKLTYKASKTAGNSNALYIASGLLGAAVTQATSWQNIIVTPVHP